MDKIKVLWMNNGDESLLDYIGDTSHYNISITACDDVAECKELLEEKANEWDAIMLNADFVREIKKNKKVLKIRGINKYDDIIPLIIQLLLGISLFKITSKYYYVLFSNFTNRLKNRIIN